MWENMGWHYGVKHASGMQVHCSPGIFKGTGSYWADISIDGRQYHTDHMTSAADAVQLVVAMMREHARKMTAAVERVGNPRRRAKR